MKNPVNSRHFAIVLTVFVSLFVFISFASAQEQKRVVRLTEYQIPSLGKMLEIIEIRITGKKIEFGKEFNADESWLRNLSFKVRNLSEKPIKFIRMSFSLPETRTAESGIGFSFTYGNPSGCNAITSPPCNFNSEEVKIVQPKEEIELKFTEQHYQGTLALVLRKTGITTLNQVVVGIAVIEYEDGTKELSNFF